MSSQPSKALWVGLLTGGLVSFTGCVGTYYDLVDPCYPERYNCKAREEVVEALQTQAANGLALQQTLYNHYFVDGSDEILPGGKALLVRLARRRPHPEPVVYVQAANDEAVLGTKDISEIAAKREALNQKRVKAVGDFLKAIRPDVAFTIAVHDPSRVGMDAREAGTAYRDMWSTAIGNLPLQGANGQGGASGGQGGMSGGGQGGGSSGGSGGGSGGGGGAR